MIAVATICGIIFGPSAAGLFDPHTWGNVDQITLEASRIVLVVQCFAIGVELPKVGPCARFFAFSLLIFVLITRIEIYGTSLEVCGLSPNSCHDLGMVDHLPNHMVDDTVPKLARFAHGRRLCHGN